MAFFLLGTYTDGRLVLLSEESYETRKEAMVALSEITNDSEFAHWDAEVSVHELSSGTAVLLVRPAAAVVEAVAEPVAETETPEPPAMPEAEVEPEAEPPAEEPAAEEVPAEEPADEETPAEDPADEALVAVMQDLDIDPEAASEEPESAGDEPEQPEPEAESPSLKEALQRTAEHMESQGVVAPESVGPAADDPAAAAWPWATGTMPAVAEAAPAEEIVAEQPEQPASAVEPAPTDEPAATPAPGPVSVFDLDVLESPSLDDGGGSLIRGAGDDETMAASRPVILGAYDEAPQPAADEPAPTPPIDAAAPDTASSDFILDLDEIATANPVSPVEQPPVERPDLSTLTCNDCVYVDTCPNKDQLQPANCGSFQWK